MEKKFIVPAVFFMAPLLIWIAVYVMLTTGSVLAGLASNALIGIFFLLGALIMFSGFRCMKAGGPRMGIVVRSGVLLVLGGLTWWKAGMNAGIAMLISTAVLACLAVFGSFEEQEKGE